MSEHIDIDKLLTPYYCYGNKRDIKKKNIHIYTKAKYKGDTLCGEYMLTINHAHEQKSAHIGCKTCIEIYLKENDKTFGYSIRVLGSHIEMLEKEHTRINVIAGSEKYIKNNNPLTLVQKRMVELEDVIKILTEFNT